MALIIVQTEDGELVGTVNINNYDLDWDAKDDLALLVREALEQEAGE